MLSRTDSFETHDYEVGYVYTWISLIIFYSINMYLEYRYSFSYSSHSKGVSVPFLKSFSIDKVHVKNSTDGRKILLNVEFDW